VQHAHRALIIHRDIKPANVLVTPDGVPKLLDFGIAKLTSIETNATPTRLMTPDYASPEQLAGKLVTTATDVFSLGLLLFELLTGAKPFAGIQRTGDTEPRRASSVSGLRALRGDLDRILLVALDPDPNRRYPSVEKFADDVRRHLDGHPVAARGASVGYRTAKFVRRNKLFVGTAPYRANLGDTAGALVSYRKALAIAEDVRARQPADMATLQLIADLHERTGWVEQRALHFRDALTHHEAARAIRESLNDRLALARTWVAIGDSRYVGRIEESSARAAYENAEQILDHLTPNTANRKDLLTETGRVHQRLGGYFTGVMEHDPARALQHHQAAERALEERAALDPHDAVAKRNFADQLVMTSALQNSVGNGAAALAGTTRALPILRDLAAADADTVEAQHDLAFAYTETARAELKLQH
jgi:tetratricopeptide (TPR) repeat protein